MTHHHRSLPEHGVRHGIPGIVKRTSPDLLIGLALIYVGAIPLSMMVDGYVRGLVQGVLLVLGPGLLLIYLVRTSGATAYVARSLDEDDIGVEPSNVAA
jgi:hypothetical protein